jgi:hypothetical protein
VSDWGYDTSKTCRGVQQMTWLKLGSDWGYDTSKTCRGVQQMTST